LGRAAAAERRATAKSNGLTATMLGKKIKAVHMKDADQNKVPRPMREAAKVRERGVSIACVAVIEIHDTCIYACLAETRSFVYLATVFRSTRNDAVTRCELIHVLGRRPRNVFFFSSVRAKTCRRPLRS
jgi:hypothetical protein